jgi:hypothetical protein
LNISLPKKKITGSLLFPLISPFSFAHCHSCFISPKNNGGKKICVQDPPKKKIPRHFFFFQKEEVLKNGQLQIAV